MSLTAQYLRGPPGYPARLSSACLSDHVSLLMVTYLTFTKLGYLIQQYYYNSYAFIPSCIVNMINIKKQRWAAQHVFLVRNTQFHSFVIVVRKTQLRSVSNFVSALCAVPERIEKGRAVPNCDFVTILRCASMQYITKLATSHVWKPRSPPLPQIKYNVMYPRGRILGRNPDKSLIVFLNITNRNVLYCVL